MLAMEKQRLSLEMQRAQRRCVEIQERLREIGNKAHRLQSFVEKPAVDTGPEQPLTDAWPLPVYSPPTDTLKRRRLTY